MNNESKIIYLTTDRHQGLYDITARVHEAVSAAKVQHGLCNVYIRGATAAIMIQENWDNSVQNDVIALLSKLIPNGAWEHDRQDGNGDSHLKAGLVGPSETIPIINGTLGLSRWQNIFVCEFDGPRDKREVAITILS
jgi:secondary thiamine-phosphate synthase enzyme